MTPSQHALHELASRGVRVSLKGEDRLHLDGPKRSLRWAAEIVRPIKAELIAYLIQLRDRHEADLAALVEVQPGVFTNPSSSSVVDGILATAGNPDTISENEPTQPPRPAGQPSLGWTKRGRMVQLPRSPEAESSDPVVLVSHLSWPDWYAPIPSDRICKSAGSRAVSQKLNFLPRANVK